MPTARPAFILLARALCLNALCSAGASAQPQALSLRRALDEADHSAFATRVAAGVAAERRAQALAPLRGILPSLRIEAGVLRTTDPVATFGGTLRQRALTSADFDPRRLNDPAAVGTYQGGLVVEQPLVDVDAWLGRRSALHAADAGSAAEHWARLATRTDVIRAFYGAVLAAERAHTLEAALRAARAHVSQAEALVRNGVATRSDALLASVRADDLEAQLAEATGASSIARQQLAVAMGRATATAIEVPTVFPGTRAIIDLASTDTSASGVASGRADIDAATQGLDAARSDAARARSTLLPRVNSFARTDWYSSARPYAGKKTWTVGVMASWSVFSGASELADVRGAAAREETARAGADAVMARARLEIEQTRTALIVALARLTIAEHAVAQSGEAHRIVARKYEGGMATVVELLDAQSTETQTRLALAQARYGVIAASAARRQAIGADPATLAALDDGDVATRDANPSRP